MLPSSARQETEESQRVTPVSTELSRFANSCLARNGIIHCPAKGTGKSFPLARTQATITTTRDLTCTSHCQMMRMPPMGLGGRGVWAPTFLNFKKLLICFSVYFLIVSISCFFGKFQCFSFFHKKLFLKCCFIFLVGEEGWRLANPKPKLVSSLGEGELLPPQTQPLPLETGVGGSLQMIAASNQRGTPPKRHGAVFLRKRARNPLETPCCRVAT